MSVLLYEEGHYEKGRSPVTSDVFASEILELSQFLQRPHSNILYKKQTKISVQTVRPGLEKNFFLVYSSWGKLEQRFGYFLLLGTYL